MSAKAEKVGIVNMDAIKDAIAILESDGDEHGVAAKLRAALAQNAQGHGDAVAFLVTDAKGKKFTIYNALLAEAIRKIAKDKGSSLQVDAVCTIPDYGWFCTRGEGHDGPCAAWPNSPTETCPTCGGPATRREVSGAFEMRNEWSHAECARVPEHPLPMDTAPRDGTMLRLLVKFDEHATEDTSAPAWTIGANEFDANGNDEWRFAGWCWTHDHFTEGKGTPVGWLPMLAAAPSHHDDPAKLPTVCDGKEQDAFEAWAKGKGYDMSCHPLHWLFLNERTYAARNGWKGAIEYVNSQISAAAPSQPDATGATP